MKETLNAPIPGQSLTGSPKNFAWERPPEITDPEEALMMHISRLNMGDKISDILDILSLDIDVRTLTEGIIRGAVANGVHSIDVGLLVAPVIHQFIVKAATDAGIDFDEGLEDTDSKVAKEKALASAKLARANFKDVPEEMADVAEDVFEDTYEEGSYEDEDESAEETEESYEEADKPRGLMARSV